MQQVLLAEAVARVGMGFPEQPQRAPQEQQVQAWAQQQESVRVQRPRRIQAQAWIRRGLQPSQERQELLQQVLRARLQAQQAPVQQPLLPDWPPGPEHFPVPMPHWLLPPARTDHALQTHVFCVFPPELCGNDPTRHPDESPMFDGESG